MKTSTYLLSPVPFFSEERLLKFHVRGRHGRHFQQRRHQKGGLGRGGVRITELPLRLLFEHLLRIDHNMSVRKPEAFLHNAVHLQLVGSIDHGHAHRVLDPRGHGESFDVDRVVRTLLQDDVPEARKDLLNFAGKLRLGTNPAGPIHEKRMPRTEEEPRGKLTHVGHCAATICSQGGLDKGKHLGMSVMVVWIN